MTKDLPESIIARGDIYHVTCAADSAHTSFNSSPADFADALTNSSTREDISRVSTGIRKHYGFDFFAIFIRLYRIQEKPACYFVREKETPWTRHYEANKCMLNDPGIRLVTQQKTPCIWSSHRFEEIKQRLTKPELAVSYQALDFGLRDVFNAPFLGRNGEMGLIRLVNSFDGNYSLENSLKIHEILPELYYVASHIYEAFARVFCPDPQQQLLSSREKDILLWTAQGKNPENVAEKYHISVNTVCKHLSNIRKKLGVRNTAHAVARAISMRLIYI